MTLNILQFTTYPIEHARHGGQIRALNTKRTLEEAGFQVENFAVFSQHSYPSGRPRIDLSLAAGPRLYPHYWQVSDFTSGEALSTDKALYGDLCREVRSKSVDVVLLEEPWLGRAILRLKNEGVLTAPIVYNSYNIEYEAKKLILEDAAIPETADIVAQIRALEQDLTAQSAACSAVTDADAAIMALWTSADVAVARNGTVKRKTAHLRGVLPAALDPAFRYMLFTGSAHPPNVSGFVELVLGSLHRLRSNERIVVVGSVCDPLYHQIQVTETPFLIRDKLCLIGQLSDYALSCVIANASGLLLPIVYGGGSNLKTAEALVSGKPIVATGKAFRGFEEFSATPRLRVADDKVGFANAIRATFDDGGDLDVERGDVDVLLWKNCLRPIVEAVKRVADIQGNDGLRGVPCSVG